MLFRPISPSIFSALTKAERKKALILYGLSPQSDKKKPPAPGLTIAVDPSLFSTV